MNGIFHVIFCPTPLSSRDRTDTFFPIHTRTDLNNRFFFSVMGISVTEIFFDLSYKNIKISGFK